MSVRSLQGVAIAPHTLTCTKCGERKPIEMFDRSRHVPGRGHRASWCKVCLREGQRTPRAREQERRRRRERGTRYGLTREQAAAIDLRAGGACEACGSTGNLHWDHCHETGEVRGRLCDGCNVALGRVGDGRDPNTAATLRALARYAEQRCRPRMEVVA